ncbi:hypothetical protein [Chlorobium sp. N1]|uniref:hypothetical protein n=1 Tax=Chlorobium sp. N1 TaxID=2491138 RepID=UPI0013F1667B|nr:hypothetical protein [Chlorobium sp. N1]
MKKVIAIASLGMCLFAGSAYAGEDIINGTIGEVNTSEGSTSNSVGVSSVAIVNVQQAWLLLAQYFGY